MEFEVYKRNKKREIGKVLKACKKRMALGKNGLLVKTLKAEKEVLEKLYINHSQNFGRREDVD